MLLPTAEGFFNAKWYQQYFQGQLTAFIDYASSISEVSVNLFMVFTGVILIISLCRIRSIMNILPDKERADLKAMIIHSTAFGLFMVSALIIAITYTLYNFFPTSP